LLLDEPLSALDPHVRGALRAELKDIQRQTGVTTVMVTHDQEEALALADLVVVLRAGRLEQAGSPRHLLEQPATPFVADFVANMNIIEARAESDERISIGATVIAGVVHGLAPGEALSVAVAQGNTRLTDPASPAACPARVRAVEFAGRSVRVIARLEASGTLIRAQAPLDSKVASGDLIGVAFDPQSLRLYTGAP
jgi:iron(III) transport system ATP-binding protein